MPHEIFKGFNCMYENHKQTTLIKFIILFLIKKIYYFFHVFKCVLTDNLILHRFITKMQLCYIQFARKTVFLTLRKNTKKNHIKSIKAKIMFILIDITCFK